jgi:hypothetical protein
MAKTKEQQVSGVSLNPEGFFEGGGLLDDLAATVVEAEFVMWDYNGKAPIPVPAAHLVLEGENKETHDQYWAAGKDFAPSGDGSSLVPTGTATGINKGSNFGILMASIVAAGFPANRLADSIKVLEGMEAHFTRVAAPKRNIQRQPRADGKEYDQTILTVSKVYKLPWEAAGKKGGAAKKGAAPTVDVDADSELVEVVTGILLERGEGITRQALSAAVFQAIKDNPNRNTLVKRVYDEGFLTSGPWEYKNGVVSMG